MNFTGPRAVRGCWFRIWDFFSHLLSIMFVTAYLAFIVLAGLCVTLEITARRLTSSQATQTAVANPAFRRYQKLFLKAYLLALWADWLQGPYLYKLYRHYNFLESQIAILYVCGLASCVLFAPVAGWLPQFLGRRQTCLLFCLAYSVCCITKLSQDYFMLMLGRVLGGLSTSLLTTVFEAWYVHGHIDVHDFPKEWIPVTFGKVADWNHGLAVGAGLVANLFAEWLGLGPVAPFLFAIPSLAACAWFVLSEWGQEDRQEGASGDKNGPLPNPLNAPKMQMSTWARFWRSCLDGLRCLLSDRRVMLLGGVQALFESVLYIFIFLWTPVLDPHGPPLGIVFSSLMAASMAGSTLFRLATVGSLSTPTWSPALLSSSACFLLLLHADVLYCAWPAPAEGISARLPSARTSLRALFPSSEFSPRPSGSHGAQSRRAGVVSFASSPLGLSGAAGSSRGGVWGRCGGDWQWHQTHVCRMCRDDAGRSACCRQPFHSGQEWCWPETRGDQTGGRNLSCRKMDTGLWTMVLYALSFLY